MATLLSDEGSALHPHVVALSDKHVPHRDLADAAHAICAVHGNASERCHDAMASSDDLALRDCLGDIADAFASERSYLATIVSAAGPLPSTPGQAQTEQAFAAARHAFQVLALADRPGCMLGAAAALVLDWATIRRILDAGARRFGVEPVASALPDRDRMAPLLEEAIGTPPRARAMLFGMQQVLAQHRALWDVLAARAGAREDH